MNDKVTSVVEVILGGSTCTSGTTAALFVYGLDQDHC
jgi:hypothetical protein